MKRLVLAFLVITALEALFYFSPHKYIPDPEGEISHFYDIDTLDIKFDGHIYVKANIAGDSVEYWFLFDTGATSSIIDEELIQKYEMDSISQSHFIDANNLIGSSSLVNIETFRLGNTRFNNNTFSADTRYKSECYGKKDYGIIGANIIRKANWYIDFRKNKMYLMRKSVPFLTTYDKTYTLPFKYQYDDARPIVNLRVNDANINEVTFDLGSNGHLNLPMETFNKYRDDFNNGSEQFNSTGEHGVGMLGAVNEKVKAVYMDSLQMGNLKLYQQFVSFETSTAKLLGTGILSFYNLFIDYRTNEIKFIPINGRGFTVTKSRNGYGFQLKLNEKKEVLISKVEENSPADSAGIEYSDKVLKINGEKFLGDKCEFNAWAGPKLVPENVTLKILNKRRIRLSYARDY